MERILARYRALCRPQEAAAIGRAIAWEQTVEVVEAAVPWPEVRERMVGRVEHIEHDGQAAHIDISYNPELAVDQLTPLLNLAYGNVSLYPQVRLTHLEIPPALADAIGGPRLGVEGIRERTGIFGRPLLCTAVKPRGAELEHLADIAYRYALGGGDVLKDDQNLAEIDLHGFQQRVLAIHQALDRAAQKTGRRCMYFPHISGVGPLMEGQLKFISGLGIQGALFCPLTLGLAVCKQAAADYDLAAMYHPAFAGTFTVPTRHGMNAEVVYGTLYRLGGADISIFPGPGGRVQLSEDNNRAIAQQLNQPLGSLKRTLPCPAGGKTLELLPDLMQLHGPDALLLVGGALLTNDPDLSVGTGRFIDAIKNEFPGDTRPQQRPVRENHSYVLKHQAQGEWSERQRQVYKASSESSSTRPDFDNVDRLPLVGSAQENTSFALRYFELAPGGYTSLECHVHSHTIIVHHGECVLRQGQQAATVEHFQEAELTEQCLKEQDIAYIDTLIPHQLVNRSEETCGFYCLVDRLRDRPQSLGAGADTAQDGKSSCELPDNK